MPLFLMLLAIGAPDETAVIQRMINRCATGGVVMLPAGTHAVSTLQLKPHCAYLGATTGTTLVLRGKNSFLMDLSERSDIRISGITFDADGQGGALLAQGFAPVRAIHIENCHFENVVSAAAYPANLTIFSSWGIIDSSFTGNRFTNVSGGIALTTVQNVTIEGNSFTDVTQSDAIFIAPNPVSFPSGEGLRIASNTGTGLAKMGVEIFRPDPPNGSRLTAPVIENNHFSRFVASNGEGMGLSITHGENAIVRGNVIDNSGGVHQENGIGIEIIVQGAQVIHNSVIGGFGYGIAVQGTRGALIASNHIDGVRKEGILFACDNQRNRCDSSGSRVEDNVIGGTTVAGIHFQNRWGGSQVVNNTITFASGQGIQESTPREGSVVRDNTIAQKRGSR
ncbi:MAG: right-handed parallel beta-helix repeat-containing protein [Acidobacteriota bacterium]|nr:right-handed parallel beta-helix repeat-containing protein [Acidobacteriota bacterium]